MAGCEAIIAVVGVDLCLYVERLSAYSITAPSLYEQLFLLVKFINDTLSVDRYPDGSADIIYTIIVIDLV